VFTARCGLIPYIKQVTFRICEYNANDVSEKSENWRHIDGLVSKNGLQFSLKRRFLEGLLLFRCYELNEVFSNDYK
jgi:hypothetical protein